MRHRGIRTLIAPAAVCTAVTLSGQCAPRPGGLEPSALRVEYLVNPLAIDVRQPRLTWEFVQHGTRRSGQTARRVLVASPPDLPAAERGDVWDSGKVASAESVNVPYDGRQLMSRERVHWKVQAWDEQDRPGP